MIGIRENFDLYSEIDNFKKMLKQPRLKLIRLSSELAKKVSDGDILTNMVHDKVGEESSRVQIGDGVGNWAFALYLNKNELVVLANIVNKNKDEYEKRVKMLQMLEKIVKSENLSLGNWSSNSEKSNTFLSFKTSLKIKNKADLLSGANIINKVYNYLSSINKPVARRKRV